MPGRHRRLAALALVPLTVGMAAVGVGAALTMDGEVVRAGSPPRQRAREAPERPAGVYGHTGRGDVRPDLRDVPTRVYVPLSRGAGLVVIDEATFEVVGRYDVGAVPHHVTPSWDLRTLYVDNTEGNSLTPVDPVTGRPGPEIPVHDPYNLYFTLDGREAVVVAERERQLDIRDPDTWELRRSVEIPCSGPDHLDFSRDGSFLLISCEFSGEVVKVDTRRWEVTGVADLGVLPVDVRLDPVGGELFWVADQGRDGVLLVDAERMAEVAFLPTGDGAHGIYPSRDARSLYVTNRLGGSVSVVDPEARRVVATWDVGGSPDMGGVTTDGRRFWLSDRYHGTVTVIDTRSGTVLRRLEVGPGPHGLAVFPQPGRFSLGHTGNYR